MRLLFKLVVGILALVGAASLVVAGWLFTSGISAQPEPSALETALARRLRSWMLPSAAWNRPNPVQRTDEAVDAGLRHFADHCSVCHANDGSGQVEMGENLYPRAPDLRAPDTQQLSDVALFYIIEEGVRLTGMPGWKTGTPEGERESWRLVHFIRHLPNLTDEQRRRMEAMNPRTRDEWRRELEIERFLEGGETESESHSSHEGGHE
jgi:mono/diheme cytochrome c family protein